MRVYLDHSATTPVLREVYDHMSQYFVEKFGNASSRHLYGREAKEVLENARNTIAGLINADPDEIYFTSGGTEADNIAILGHCRSSGKRTVLISSIEHEAVIEPCEFLRQNGYKIIYIDVDKNGIINLEHLEECMDDDTAMISIMTANNEVGSIQPVREISEMAREKGITFHSDAVQALGKMDVNVKDTGFDMLSASSHKFYGPKGAGFLYIRKGINVFPVMFGGGHERNIRSGTENVSGCAGMAEALRICCGILRDYTIKYREWKDRIIAGLSDIEGFSLNQDIERSLPNILNISFAGLSGESIAEMLSMHQIAVSTASACASHKKAEKGYSRVLEKMGIDEELARSAIRVSTGIDNDDGQIAYFIDKLKITVEKLRSYGSVF